MKTYHKISNLFKKGTNDYSWDVFKQLENIDWLVTEKIDGTNIRVIFDGDTLSFKGKGDNAEMFPGVEDILNKLFNVKKMKEVFPDLKENNQVVCLYGEAYGAGINKGGKYCDDKRFIVFDILFTNPEGNDKFWLLWDDLVEVCGKLEVKHVNHVSIMCFINGRFIHKPKISNINSFICDTPTSFLGKSHIMEGVICKPCPDLFDRKGQRIIFKLKTENFK